VVSHGIFCHGWSSSDLVVVDLLSHGDVLVVVSHGDILVVVSHGRLWSDLVNVDYGRI
jgi:hypothetical protein